MRPSGKVGGTVQLLEDDRRMSSYLERQSVLNQGSVKSAFPPEGDRDPSDYIERPSVHQKTPVRVKRGKTMCTSVLVLDISRALTHQ